MDAVVTYTGHGSAPIVPAADVDALVARLEGLGFRCPAENRFGEPGGPTLYATASLGDAYLHVQRRDSLPFDDRGEHETDAYIYVDDVDALHARALECGDTIFRDLYDEPYGMRDCTVSFPEGQRIAFGSSLED